jgi:AAA15 family ATPase/GTPase
MLVDYSVTNYGPFRDEAVLSLQCTSASEHEENVLGKETIKEGLLNSVVVFGANASGKSFLIRAFADLKNLVRAPAPANTSIVSYNPFRLSPQTKGAPTVMKVRFISGGILYNYYVKYNATQILEESLEYYPKKQKVNVFHRNGDVYKFGSGKTSTGQKAISKMTNPNSTYLSVAAQFNNEICLEAHRWINSVIIIVGDMNAMLNETIEIMNRDQEMKKAVVDALTIADFGIDDVNGNVGVRNVSEMTDTLPPQLIGLMMMSGNTKVNERKLSMRHHVSTAGVSEEDRTFPYYLESNGTMRMLCVIGPIINSLRSGSVVMMDEFGSFLHHDICKWIIGLFKLPENSNGAQLVINTHDQLLMDTTELFRRDQVYFTEKDPETGNSKLFALSDFRTRKNSNAQKGYETGRFGAVPFISPGDTIYEQK